MRTLLMRVLTGSVLALGACQTTGVQSADLGDADRYVVSGGQSRFSVEVPRHDMNDLHTHGAYSMTGDDVRQEVLSSVRTDARDTSRFVRHATNGN